MERPRLLITPNEVLIGSQLMVATLVSDYVLNAVRTLIGFNTTPRYHLQSLYDAAYSP